MKKSLFLLITLLILSCNNAYNKVVIQETIDSNEIVNNTENQEISSPTSGEKVEINFLKNKDLLDIILLLPETDFSSWQWKLQDRIDWYNEIKANNFYIDKDPLYFNLNYFEPNTAGFVIVDGYWSISIYKTTENSFIVITDDVVGDGNELNFYEVKNNTIKPYLNGNEIFPDFKELLKKKNTLATCSDKFEELNDPIFNYDFSNNDTIEIESSWSLTEENYGDCLIGNAIVYRFNRSVNKFEIEKIYWKPKVKHQE